MNQKMTRGAILLAITIALQLSLRELGGLGPIAKIMVGICINACLLLTVYYSNWVAIVLNAFAAPLIAIMFGALPTAMFLYPVVAANIFYAFSFKGLLNKFGSTFGAVVLSTFIRCGVFILVGLSVFFLFQIKAAAPGVLLPFAGIQLITGSVGGFLAVYIYRRVDSLS